MESVPKGYPVNSANTVQNDAYTLFNLRLGYDYKPWNFSAYFEARNLTDTRYAAAVTVDDANGRFFLPGDGRAFYGGSAGDGNEPASVMDRQTRVHPCHETDGGAVPFDALDNPHTGCPDRSRTMR